MKRTLILIPLLFVMLSLSAQLDVSRESVKFWYLNPHIGMQIPGGDMKERFHTNALVGFGVNRKSADNWILGLNWSYLFAEKVRNEHEILKNISTSEGHVIDQTGVFANILFRQRGFYGHMQFGRVFPTRLGNLNSGVVLMGTAGYLQHKIRIEVHENTAPQLDNDYKKGYDKLTGGPGGSLYLGYMHMSNNKFVNFSLGVEYFISSTRSLRDYDYVLMARDESIRRDNLLTIRFNWMIPVYARAPKEFYL
jgi:hypothetical protein